MKDNLEWIEEMPQVARQRVIDGGVEQLLVHLKKRPGVWAVYRTMDGKKKWGQGTWHRRRYPGTEWAQRTIGDTKTIYVRWVGETNV
jgi:hypothetical protein